MIASLDSGHAYDCAANAKEFGLCRSQACYLLVVDTAWTLQSLAVTCDQTLYYGILILPSPNKKPI